MLNFSRGNKQRTIWLSLAAAVGTAGVAGAALKKWGIQGTPPGAQGGDEGKPRIVVLGAGFAGLAAARKLGERLKGRAEIVLVDRENYQLFTPALYQAATMGIDPYNVASPVREVASRRGIVFRRAEVAELDFAAGRVYLDSGDLEYDYLVIALGTTSNFFGNDSAREHAFPLKWLHEGISIRNHVIDMLERASLAADDAESQRKELLTFTVVGGGATGVETAAALATALRTVLPLDFPSLDPSSIRIVVIESEGKLLGHMDERMARLALKRLRSIGVEVWLNCKAKDVAPGRVTTDDERTLQTHTVIWTTGVRVPEVVAKLDAEHGKGGSLAVDNCLRVCGHSNVFAVGDNAHFTDSTSGKVLPLLAAVAVQQGSAAAENIARAIAGEDLMPFRYRDMGSVVALGRYAGVAKAGPLVIGGLPGWLIWRLIHLVKISSFRNQLEAAIDWGINYLHGPDTARIEQFSRRTRERRAAQSSEAAG